MRCCVDSTVVRILPRRLGRGQEKRGKLTKDGTLLTTLTLAVGTNTVKVGA